MKGAVTLSGRRWSIGPRRFSPMLAEIVAMVPEDVLPAVRLAEKAARDGRWVAGVVCYEAASGLDPTLMTVPGRVPIPLVWFGVFADAGPIDLAAGAPVELGGWTAGMSAEEHGLRVADIRRSIAAGDTYQVNLTFPMVSNSAGGSPELFSAMLAAQPDCYGALVETGHGDVVSVSPELFVRVAGRGVVAVPMKGTAPRGRWPAEDLEAADSLIASEKEQAGNVMIVDLIRNDLGRVAEPGSVVVPHLFQVERHPTLWQMTSTVTATLTEGKGIADLFVAAFPSGSVTGAPKPSTMAIIAQHERIPRGPYCGAIGYIAPGGERAEFSVAIRTGVLVDRQFTYHVGGGITSDSLAGSEYEECLLKALVVTDSQTPPDLIETMRFEPGIGIPLLSRHIDRLTASADFWGIDIDLEGVADALSAVQSEQPAKVRLLARSQGSVDVEVEPIAVVSNPVGLIISNQRVDPQRSEWYHKTLSRSRYPHTEEGIEAVLSNLDGDITETNISNIFLKLDGQWLTPPIESGCLPGVLRSTILDEGRARSRPLSLDQLKRAEQIAVTNAVRGWRKAFLIE